MPRLNAALNQGLDAGLTVNDAKEVLVQLYAYAGFPRSLNALGELMKVVEARKQRGMQDAPGRAPSRADSHGRRAAGGRHRQPDQALGRPVKGPLFEFAPAIDEFLKTISSATSSSVTTSTGKAANSPPWACCPRCRAPTRSCRRTWASA